MKQLIQDHERTHEEAQFSCDFCDKKFKVKKHWQAHVNKHNGILEFKCVPCNKVRFSKAFFDNLIQISKSLILILGLWFEKILALSYDARRGAQTKSSSKSSEKVSNLLIALLN